MNQALMKQDMTPRTLEESMTFAEKLSTSKLVPQAYQGKPNDILVAMQYGFEIGLAPMQALSGIAVINGRATLWGDAALAVVLKSGLLENFKEMTADEIKAAGKAQFWGKRKGVAEPIIREFSIEDAKKAGLWGKAGPWTNYWPRMLQMRARGFGLRDGWSDALKGLAIREEMEDLVSTTEAPRVLTMPRRLSETAAETEQVDPLVTKQQLEDLNNVRKEAGYSDDHIKTLINSCGYATGADIKVKHYQAILETIENSPIERFAETIEILSKWCKEN